jgi:hypothetical protein
VCDELVLEKLLDGLESLPASEVANAGNELSSYVLVITHAHLDGS